MREVSFVLVVGRSTSCDSVGILGTILLLTAPNLIRLRKVVPNIQFLYLEKVKKEKKLGDALLKSVSDTVIHSFIFGDT